jgi:NADH dehydrogenase [ubiquinone] 1 alpha subcomplex assembly factor 7
MSYDPEARRETPLSLKLIERIRRDGPITVAEYMQACLQDPEHGYYVKQTAIGRAGDFITAPEVSQVFGELIGLWAAVVWQQMGAPSRVNFVELGPGRGTLMRDALRAASKSAAFFQALEVHLVEVNEGLAGLQNAALVQSGKQIAWHPTLQTVPHAPAIVVANEFLDTAPVRQTIGDDERRVGIDAGNRLVFDPANGLVTERQDQTALVAELSTRAKREPLAALFIDYGHVRSAGGDTLQALRKHTPEHPLCSPGEADLTVQVDFQAVAAAFQIDGLAVDGPIAQGEFLGRLGIVERASRLMHANPLKAAEIELGVARLIAPQGMGSRFKAMGVRSADLPCLPGFEG